MSNKIAVGKYILEHWVNGDHESRTLRLVTRETDKYFIADVQRDIEDYNFEEKLYVFEDDYAKKYEKDSSQLGFKPNICLKEGQVSFVILDSPTQAKSSVKFEEVFDIDLRTIQHKEDYPLKSLILENSRREERGNIVEAEDYKIRIWKADPNNTDPIMGWDRKITDKLGELFCTKEIYYFEDCIIERNKTTVLSKTGTMFHLNTFGIEKAAIDFNENYNNRAILFWLFDDKLIFRYEDGKDTW